MNPRRQLLLAGLALAAPVRGAMPGMGTVYANGRCLLDGRFVEQDLYVVDSRFSDLPPVKVQQRVDLAGGWVVPPFAEAHNHNVDSTWGADVALPRYLRDGVFYIANPNNLATQVAPLGARLGGPGRPEVLFSHGGITGAGGHPQRLYRQLLERGVPLAPDAAALADAAYFEVPDAPTLAAKWPQIVAQRPDFIKLYLLDSDRFAERLLLPQTEGVRGLDPALVPLVVARAQAAGLRVAAHVETAADLRLACRAGVNWLAHLPGYLGGRDRPEAYRLSADDARLCAARGVVVTTTTGVARMRAPELEAIRAVQRANLDALRAAGATVLIGSDNYLDSSLAEIRHLRTLGVDDATLLDWWSRVTPQFLFPGRRLGALRPGYEASFVVLARNPHDDLPAAVESIRLRVKQGVRVEVQ
jgi:imidazolonepropionase-like amidohydrolase